MRTHIEKQQFASIKPPRLPYPANLVPIPNFDGRYLLKDNREVFRVNKAKVVYTRTGPVKRAKMKPVRPCAGYGGLRFKLWKDGIPYRLYLHHIVALCHVPNPQQKPYVKFLDNNPLNLTASNLKWTGCPAGL